MADWQTMSPLATGLGTLVLAVATFSAVRSPSRPARVADQALSAGLRPLLVQSRAGDPEQKVDRPDPRSGARALAPGA